MKNQSSLHALLTVCALFALAPLAGAASYVWNVPSPGGLNNWNVSANWNPNGNPGTGDTVIFGATGTNTSSTTTNNIVSVNTTITSLTYNQPSNSTYHVTAIPDGVTLTVSGTFTNGGIVADSITTKTYMTGGGTFVANGTPFIIGNNGSANADQGTILDLSALNNFVYNSISGTITMSTGNRSGADFKLAGVSNNITAGTWNHNIASSSSSASGTLTLGAGTNIINVGTFNIGAARESATVAFPATGGLKLRGTGGTDADRTTMIVGNRSSGNSSASSSSGTLSFNGHAIDAKVSILTLGENTQNANASLTENGIFSFNQGTFDATTIIMALIPSVNTMASSVANSTISVGSTGTLIVGSGGISLVNLAGTGAGDAATGTLIVTNGGTATCAGSITKASTSGTGNIAISSGFLTVQGTIGSASIPVDNLNMTNATLTLPAAATASATVTNLNSQGTTNTINVSSVSAITVYPTQFPLIKYTTSSGDLTIIGLGTLPGIFQGYISNNTANLSIDVVLTGGPPPSKPVVWNGTVNGNWDTTTANWKSALLFNQNDFTTFDDTALGTTTVNLTTAITPGSLTINNSALNYTFNGTGSLTGSAGLIKSGTGTLVLDNSGVNNFSGGVTINAGTVQFGNNDVNGNLPAGNVTDNGALVISRSDSNTVANVISGTGSVTNSGSGTLTLSAANSFTGNLTINAGTVRPTVVRAPGAGTLTVNGGGALVLINGITNAITLAGGTLGATAGDFTGTSTVLTAAAGTTSFVQTADPQNPSTSRNIYADMVLNGSGNIFVIPATNILTVDGNQAFRLRGTNLISTFSGTIILTNNAKGEMLVATNGTFSPGGTGKFIMVGGNFLGDGSLSNALPTGAYSEINLRNNSISNAVLGNNFEIVGSGLVILGLLGNAPNNATLTLGNLKVGGGQEVGVYVGSGNSHIGVFPTVTLTGGNAKFSPKTPGLGATNSTGSDLSLGNISELTSGSGIIMAGWRTLYLTGTNTYTGPTLISSGTLALTGSATISNTPSITIASGAKLDVSGLTNGTFALGSSQTLSNNTSTGTLIGSASTGSGTVSLTYASGTPALTVTNGTLTLSSTTVFKVNNTAATLPHGSYKIISTNTAGTVAVSGSLPSVTVSGGGVTSGVTPSLQITGGEMYLVVPNRPPVVRNTVANSVTSGLLWRISIADLQTAGGWSDPDGDTVTLSSVTSPSFSGTNVTSDGTFVYYNGPVTAQDHFTYTISDGQGGTANGTVYLIAVAGKAPTLSNPTTDSNGHPTFSGNGIPGVEYGVESATSLSGPWFNAGTVTAGATGSWSFTDASESNPPMIFYRLYYPYSAGNPPQ